MDVTEALFDPGDFGERGRSELEWDGGSVERKGEIGEDAPGVVALFGFGEEAIVVGVDGWKQGIEDLGAWREAELHFNAVGPDVERGSLQVFVEAMRAGGGGGEGQDERCDEDARGHLEVRARP